MKELETSLHAGRLMTLAEKANKAHRHAQSAARRRVKHGLEAGRLLLEAKETVGHGNFTEWIEKNFEGTPRHARRYMTFATAVEQNRIDPDQVSSLSEVERLLREPHAEQTHGEYEPEVPGEEYDFRERDAESDPEEPDAESEPARQPAKGPSTSKKKDVDPLRDSLKAIGRTLGAASDEQRTEWAQILHDEIDLWLHEWREPEEGEVEWADMVDAMVADVDGPTPTMKKSDEESEASRPALPWVLGEDGDVLHDCGQQASQVGGRSYQCVCGSRLTNRMGRRAAEVISFAIAIKDLLRLQGKDIKVGVAQRSPEEALAALRETAFWNKDVYDSPGGGSEQ